MGGYAPVPTCPGPERQNQGVILVVGASETAGTKPIKRAMWCSSVPRRCGVVG